MDTVRVGFVSFTEVAAGEHRSYNEWHLYDHLPEQFSIPGVVWGQRWVLPPPLRRYRRADPPLDRVHYVTLYLMAAPVAVALEEFRSLGSRLRGEGRFHLHRTSHLSGAVALRSTGAAPRTLVSPAVIPYRPGTGVHVRVEPERADRQQLDGIPGVAGVWQFAGDDALSPPALQRMQLTWCWLDGDLDATAERLAAFEADGDRLFEATFTTVEPYGPWDWFDGDESTAASSRGRP